MAKGSSKDQGPRSALEASLRAYQAGDMVQARRLAQRVLAAPSAADGEAAKKVAGEVFAAPGATDAAAVATELVARTKTELRPYSLAGIAILLWGLWAYFASTRT